MGGDIFSLNFAIHIPASMKTKQTCIWSAFWKHGWILLKPGVQVSIEHCTEENEKGSLDAQNSSHNVNMGIFGRQGDRYVVIGRPGYLVSELTGDVTGISSV